MSQNGSNANKSAITVALIAGRAAIVAALIAAAAVLVSGGSSSGTNLAAVTTSSQRVTFSNSSSPTPVPSATGSASSNGSPVCTTGSLTLVGSTAFQQIAQDAAEAYMQNCPPGVTITVNAGGSTYNGDSDYGLTQLQSLVNSGSSKAKYIIAMYDGTSTGTNRLKAYPMGFLIFSVVAYADLFPGSNIATGELVTIFVKHGDRGVVAVGRRAGSGSRKAFIMTVLGLNPASPDKGSCPTPTGSAVSFVSCTARSTQDLLTFVNGTPNAIGYADTYGPFPGYRHVSVLSIDGIAPSIPNVRNGLYKFWAVEHLYASVNAAPLTKDFLAFLPNYIKSHPPQDFIACSDAPNGLEADCQLAIPTSPRPTSSTSQRPSPQNPLPAWVVPLLATIGTLLFIATGILLFIWWRTRTRHPPGSEQPGSSVPGLAVREPTSKGSQPDAGPVPNVAESAIQPVTESKPVDERRLPLNAGRPTTIRAFISYSHDNDEHRNNILDLAQQLRRAGIDARIDQFTENAPPRSWPNWMEEQIASSDFVLVVATETYQRRFMNRETPSRGHGVRFEGAIITEDLYHTSNEKVKFIPVVASPSDSQYIPSSLKLTNWYNIGAIGDRDLRPLLRHLLSKPAVIPEPLGPVADLGPRHGPSGSADVKDSSLPPEAK